jgi:hypothetical protein
MIASVSCKLSDSWQVFGPLDREDRIEATPARQAPATLSFKGRTLTPITASAHEQLDLAPLLGGVAEGKTAWVFIPFAVEQAGKVAFGIGANWWFEALVDGRPLLDTLCVTGNGSALPSCGHRQETELAAGEHLLAVRVISGTGGFQLCVAAGTEAEIDAIASAMERQRQQPVTVTIDFGAEAGALRALNGVNLGPLTWDGGLDCSPYFKMAKFPFVRLHDCPYYYREVVDIPCIFPLQHLDAADPANYKFARTDGYLQSILDCGAQIVYRLGVSIQGHKVYRYDTEPPADPDKWADICINIIRHYNEGWANGFHHNIRYWEIWNEPDNGPNMWDGSYEEYCDFYVRVAKRIKAACPAIKIGGPAFNGAMIDVKGHLPTVKLFLDKVTQSGAPLDFLSWHVYPLVASNLVRSAKDVRAILDTYGLSAVESHLNEWNLAPTGGLWAPQINKPHLGARWSRALKGPETAALVAAALTQLQDAPVDVVNFYDASCGRFGLFTSDGAPGKPFHVFTLFNRLLEETPRRLVGAVKGNGDELTVLATESADHQKRNLLIANQKSLEADWRLELTGLDAGEYAFETRVLDEHQDFALDRRGTLHGPRAGLDLFVPTSSVMSIDLARKR